MSWHTDPQEPDYTVTNHTESLDLKSLVNADSYTPLYALLEAKTKGASKSESTLWLQGLLNDFDLYVTRELHRVHYQPWGRDWEIRSEYERQYKQKPNPEWNLRAIAARLMSFKEIKQYVKDESFWTRPKEKPVYSLDCLSGGIINEQTRPWKYVTGIHPTDKKRGYVLTFEKPWLGKHVDPVHHWGVYMDKSLTTRYFMACCGELVGQSEGCWINLKEDTTAIVGVIKPYQLFPTVFNNVWENDKLPIAADIEKDVIIGTAFRDKAKYAALHAQIQSSWKAASRIIADAYAAYMLALQNQLDANDSDRIRETNPFDQILDAQGRTSIETPIRLVLQYNEIQCMGALVPPLLRDYVNEKIFRVADMLKYFTYEKKGGLEFQTKTVGVKDRLKMLNTTELEKTDSTSRLTELINKIDTNLAAIDPKAAALKDVSTAAKDVRTAINRYNNAQENARRRQLKRLQSDFEELGEDAKYLAAAGLTLVEWDNLQEQVLRIEQLEPAIVQKQQGINATLQSLRAGKKYVAPPGSLPSPAVLQPATLQEVEFGKVLTAALIVKKLPSIKSAQEPKLGDVTGNPTVVAVYDRIVAGHQNLVDLEKYPKRNTPSAQIEKSDPVKAAQNTFEIEWEAIVTDVKKDKQKLQRMGEMLRFIMQETNDQDVQNKTLAQSNLDKYVKTIEASVLTYTTRKQDAVAAYNKEIATAESNYKAEQARFTATAMNTLNTFNAKLTPADATTAGEIQQRVKNLLLAAETLKPIDDLSSVYLGYEQKIREILDLVKDPALVITAPQIQQDAYIKAWNGKDSLFKAAENLANALKALLQTTTRAKAETDIVDILTKAKTSATQAAGEIESEPERLARLAREKAAKEEADRKAREEAERQRRAKEEADENQANFVRSQLPKFVQWLTKSGSSFIGDSNTGLSADKGLRNLGSFQDNNVKKALVDNNVFLSDGSIPEFLQTGLASISRQYRGIYLETTNLSPIEATWKALGEYVFYLTTSQEKQKEQSLLNTLTAYKAEVPRRLLSVVEEDRGVNVGVNKYAFQSTFSTLTMPKDDMFYRETILWNSNSCWLDSAFLAFFAYPQNKIAERVINTDTIVNTVRRLDFSDKQTLYTNLECKDSDLERLHDAIVGGVFQMEQPKPSSPICSLSVRDLWTRCVIGHLTEISPDVAESQTNESAAVIDTLEKFYQLQNMLQRELLGSPPASYEDDTKTSLFTLEQECVARNIPYAGKTRQEVFDLLSFDYLNHVWITPSKSASVLYQITDTGTQTTRAFSTITETRNILKVDLENDSFVLYAIICADAGHYVTWLKDFYANKWVFINVNPSEDRFTNPWIMKERDDLTYESGISVHDMQRAPYKPTQYFYIAKSEIVRLLKKFKPDDAKLKDAITRLTGVAATVSTSVLQFSTDPTERLPINDEARIRDLHGDTQLSAFDLLDEQRKDLLLSYNWSQVGNYILSLDAVRLEGLLHAWFAARAGGSDWEQRVVVGLSRADLDFNPSAPAPAPKAIPVALAPAPKKSLVLESLGLNLYAKPTDGVSFLADYTAIEPKLRGRPELGLNVRFADLEKEPYRLTGLMHAWWGLENNDEEAMVRGAAMADL